MLDMALLGRDGLVGRLLATRYDTFPRRTSDFPTPSRTLPANLHVRDTLIGLIVGFLVINTITVGLRVWVRARITKSFGYDDVFMLVTYAALVITFALALSAVLYTEALDYDRASTYDFGFTVTCYLTAGLVKVSVALVLFKITAKTSTMIRTLLVWSIISCAIWSVVSTTVSATGCMPPSPHDFGHLTCRRNDYARQAMYISYDIFYTLIPIAILWNLQISLWQKISVVGLFAVGLCATVATIMKLLVIIQWQHATDQAEANSLWLWLVIWSVTEHGLALFACTILALRPLFRLLGRGWTSARSSWAGTGAGVDSAKRVSAAGNSTSTSSARPRGLARPSETRSCRPSADDAFGGNHPSHVDVFASHDSRSSLVCHQRV